MKITIIGCGVMGEAIARQISKTHELYLCDHKKDQRDRLAQELGGESCDLKDAAKDSEMMILATKPTGLDEVRSELASKIKKGQIVLSIMAGASIKLLQSSFPQATVFRTMPNLPLLCGQGMIGIADDPLVGKEWKEKVEGVMKELGRVYWLKESLMNAFTALTGSNPAFIYLVIEAMIEAGISLGLKAPIAQEYILGTIEGSVALLRKMDKSPEELRWQICSPGGTTIAGLNELERQNVRAGITEGLIKTFERASEMEGA